MEENYVSDGLYDTHINIIKKRADYLQYMCANNKVGTIYLYILIVNRITNIIKCPLGAQGAWGRVIRFDSSAQTRIE